MKKIISVILICFMLIPGLSVCAKETAKLPAFDVSFNGQSVESGYRQFPLIVYKDITYVPMTYYDCRYLGLSTNWDNDTRTLYIDKSNVTTAYRSYDWQWKNGTSHEISVCDFNVVVNGKEIDNSKEEYPLLTLRDVTYFPLTWRFAVEEFGWEYNFGLDTGLSIVSDNYHARNIHLPNITGNVATDGNFYYYCGDKDGKKVVYRVSVSDTSSPEVIHEVPDYMLGQSTGFSNSDGDIYVSYSLGSGAIMSTQYYYKIESDGSLTRKNPNNYSGGKHGYSEITKMTDGIFVKAVNEFVDSPTKITYTIDGIEKEAETLSGRVRIGRRRNGIMDYNVSGQTSHIQIFKDKIYYTATDLNTDNDSALYSIDTKTGENKKILDGVCGFHVYNGWLNEENADSTMIVYDNGGSLMRYSELNGEVREIEKSQDGDELILQSAVGEYDIYTVQKNAGGNRCTVKVFSCYASGNASVNGAVLLDTKTGTNILKKDGRLCVIVSGESADDEVRFLVVGDGKQSFMSADAVSDVFIYGNILLYKIGKDNVVRVDLR